MKFERLLRNWENLARQDPMWAILSDNTRKGGKWNADEFFATGREFVDWLGSWFGGHGIDVGRGVAVDFGCGIGRLTQALAPHFARTIGIDASPSMVQQAIAHNRHGAKVTYLCNQTVDLAVLPDATADLVLSVIVLQHMRPEYARAYLREFVRLLKPGGLAFFQMPVGVLATEHANTSDEQGADDEAFMEMHCLGKDDVQATVAQAGGRVLRCEDDTWAMPGWSSAHYLVGRAPAQ